MKHINIGALTVSCIFAVLLLLSGCAADGADGLSAYEIAVKNGMTQAKSESEWLLELQGKDGKDGKSAYDLAKEAGFDGSIEDWLKSLQGPSGADGADGKDGKDGKDGSSAYQIAVANGYTKTEAEWVAELLGSGQSSGTGSGVGIASVQVNSDKHLIVKLTNGTLIDAGYVGVKGEAENNVQTGTVDSDGYRVVNQIVEVITGALNVRSSPDSSSGSNIVVSLQMGERLTRTGIGTGDNTWSRVLYNGQICYASSKYLEVKSENANVDLTGVDMPGVNFPDEYIIPVGKETAFEVDQFVVGLDDSMYTSFDYSGSGTKQISERSIKITPKAAETATLTFSIKKYVKGDLVSIYSKTARLISVTDSNKAVTGLVIGDSRVAEGTLVDSLKLNMGSSLTLIGTLKSSSGNAHEGRSSWSTSNYLSYATATGLDNPFYNETTKKFDFSYYLSSTKQSAPDFILFYLGANDGYRSIAILNYGEMIESVKAYNKTSIKQVKILIMHEYLAPREGYSVSYAFDSAVRRDEQFDYFDKLTNAFGGREHEGIYLIPAHTCIDADGDRVKTDGKISDVIHLSKAGYRKQADIVSAYIYAIFSVK